jgi:hypothetical protein
MWSDQTTAMRIVVKGLAQVVRAGFRSGPRNDD